tara:strand:- start:4555 stop:5145 length:591 start_codon:yes stop_codon:yes gene_type:complete
MSSQNFLSRFKQPFLNTADFILGGEGFISGQSTPSTEAFMKFLRDTTTNDKGEIIFKDDKNLIDGYAGIFKEGELNAGGVLQRAKNMFSPGSSTGGTKEGTKEGTYGGLTRQDLLGIQKAGFDQQNELLKKGMIVNAGKDIGRGFMAGPQAYLQNVLPQMFAGNAAVLSAGASGTGSLANVYRMPPVQIRKQGFYS